MFAFLRPPRKANYYPNGVHAVTDRNRALDEAEELALRRSYEERRACLEGLAEAIRHACTRVLEHGDVPCHSVKARVKSLPSALEKIVRKGYPRSLDPVEDLVGIRIICLYASDIDTITELLKREFKIIGYVDKRPQNDSDHFGYSSVHVVCTVEGTPRADLHEYAGMQTMPFEIQVRTILQEAWAEIEHRLVYKSEVAAPKDVRRLINRISGFLEIADEQFQEIYDRREAYAKTLKEANTQFLEDQPLNVDSLMEAIDRRFAWAEGWREDAGEKLTAYLDDLLGDLFSLGVTTVRQLIGILDKWSGSAYQESHHGYMVATKQAKAEGTRDGRWGFLDETKTWSHKYKQYLLPIGQVRVALEKEFPEYARRWDPKPLPAGAPSQ
jgi:ppGpp synthetase/RelA/SpoT-type nucleotidyltranferase